MVTMHDCLELEISLSRHDRNSHIVELRLDDPKAQALRTPECGPTRFNVDKLRDQALDRTAYGRQLFKYLFAPANVLQLYTEARNRAQQQNRPLRLRLFIQRDALELHDLHWETLEDERPGTGWLLTKDRLLFSRFLSSANWETVTSRAESQLRALVVIANPSDLDRGKFFPGGQPGPEAKTPLASINVAQEIQRARQGLGDLFRDEDCLHSDADQPGQVTLDRLRQGLRQGFDIVYLVCHGALITQGDKPGPQLLLEKADGTGEFVAGSDLIEQVQNMAPELRPRLVVLASCQSAGLGGEAVTADALGALAALGPQLAQAGVPAVLAMQGSISMTTVANFMPNFFTELRKDGQIDRAMATARSAVAQRPDSWMPVLYSRLRDGSLWYTPSFGGENPEFIWGRLLTGIADQGKCTPILGPGMSEYLCGSHRQVAQSWAEQENYPLAERGREELPQIAQYLTNRDGPGAPRKILIDHILEQIKRHFAKDLPADLAGNTPEETLEKLIAAIGRRKDQFQNDAYSVLAGLPFHVYLNTNPDNMLTQALLDADKKPVVDFARWNTALQDLQQYPSAYEEERAKNYTPTAKRPLVYHLFGTLKVRESLILSEDDYFDYLMWINQSQAPLPAPVGRALSANGLLFLGFGVLDWNFRVLFRSLLNEQRRKLPRSYKSVAVQVRPGEDILNPELARFYLEQYLANAEIGIFWGSADDFIKELRKRAQQKGLL